MAYPTQTMCALRLRCALQCWSLYVFKMLTGAYRADVVDERKKKLFCQTIQNNVMGGYCVSASGPVLPAKRDKFCHSHLQPLGYYFLSYVRRQFVCIAFAVSVGPLFISLQLNRRLGTSTRGEERWRQAKCLLLSPLPLPSAGLSLEPRGRRQNWMRWLLPVGLLAVSI